MAAGATLAAAALAITLLSGGVYNWMYAPTSTGEAFDAETGMVKQVVIWPARVQSQYLIESISVGVVLATGSLGVFLIHSGVDFSGTSIHKRRLRRSNNAAAGIADVSFIRVILGMLLFALAYSIMGNFLKIKIPNYFS